MYVLNIVGSGPAGLHQRPTCEEVLLHYRHLVMSHDIGLQAQAEVYDPVRTNPLAYKARGACLIVDYVASKVLEERMGCTV